MELDINFTLLLMIFLRMSGCIQFNPIFGRNNIPVLARVGLTLILSLFTYKIVPPQNLQINSVTVFCLAGIKELLIGFIIGFIIQMFLSVIVMGGEMIDMQIGISMSRIYDPQSNVSMPLSASLINTMFILLFFVSNAHLTLIRIFTQLCVMVPYGDHLIAPNAYQNLVGMFSLMLIYAVKMSLPMVAVQFISEIGVGLITRAVPQIDIFSVQIQLKLMIGFFAMLILVPSYSSFLERMITLMFDNIGNISRMLT